MENNETTTYIYSGSNGLYEETEIKMESQTNVSVHMCLVFNTNLTFLYSDCYTCNKFEINAD